MYNKKQAKPMPRAKYEFIFTRDSITIRQATKGTGRALVNFSKEVKRQLENKDFSEIDQWSYTRRLIEPKECDGVHTTTKELFECQDCEKFFK